MSKTRRRYTREFKLAAVKLIPEQGRSVADAARSGGVSDKPLRYWKSTLLDQGESAFPGNGNRSPADFCDPSSQGGEPPSAHGTPHFKSDGLLCQGVAMKYAFLEPHKATWPITVMAELLGVSPSGSYAWRDRPISHRQQQNDELLVQIQTIHEEVKHRHGSPRIHAELNAPGHPWCVNTVAEIMRQAGIRAKTARKFKHTTDSNHSHPVAENVLDRQFQVDTPNQVWVTDITYIPTREGWLYLAATEDLYSRMVVGWWMDRTMTSRLVVDALAMAIQRRFPSEELLAHSDRESQYASEHYQRLLGKHGIECSMSGVGQCWDNAAMESFFASLKKALIHLEDYQTREEAKASIFEYIEMFSNRKRRHSTLGYVSPAEWEQSV
jgi:transposase InsO family protein